MSESNWPDKTAEGLATNFSRRASRRAKAAGRRKGVGRERTTEPCGAEWLEPRLFLSAITFQPQQTFATGPNPYSVAVADLGNGHADIIAANDGGSAVSVLLGNGNGTFKPQQTFATGNHPISVAVADLGNGHLDLVVANYSGGVSVLLGNGNGTFQPQQTFATGNHPYCIAVADLGNGEPDLLVANISSNTVSVLLGNGNGTFQAQQTFATGTGPQSLAVADLGNGHLDLVVANVTDGTIGVLLGNGDGTFQGQQTFAAGSVPDAVAVADLGNGHPDVVVANFNADCVSVLLGNGNGTFQGQQSFATGHQPASVTLDDLGNGQLDVVVANYGNDTVSVLLGNGSGTFQTQQTFAAGPAPTSVAVADVNGDGQHDLVVANYGSTTVSVLLAPLVAVASTTMLQASTGSVAQGGSVTFAATVSPATGNGATPTGTVSFIVNGSSIGTAPVQGNGNAVMSTTSLPAGMDTVIASYGGDPAYLPSMSSGAVVQVLAPLAASNTTLQASATSVSVGSPVTLTATVTPAASGVPPTGDVSFIENDIAIGTASVQSDGTAVLITSALPAGMNSITANYGGDSNYQSSTSAVFTVQVTGALAASTTALVASAPPAFAGVPVTFTATVSPAAGAGQTPTGSVTFFDGTTALGAAVPLDSGGAAQLSTAALEVGSHSITATYSGDNVYAPDSSPALTEVIGNPLSATIVAPDVTISQTAGEVVTIEFKDASFPIDVPDITVANLTIAGPMGTTPGISSVSLVTNDDLGQDVTASYTLSPPGTSWGASALGSYVVNLLAGSVQDMAGNAVAAGTASFSVNGVEDTSFGLSGNVTVNFACEAVVPLDGGSLLVGKQGSSTAGTLQGVLELLDENGNPVPSFGANGIATTSIGANDVFNNALIDANGNIVAIGATNESFLVARYISSSGTPDPSFGTGGFATADFGAQDPAAASGVALEPNGAIVAAGGANGQFALARFIASGANAGSLDPTFNPGGASDPNFSSGGQLTTTMTVPGLVVQVVVNPEGQIISLGSNGSGLVPFALNYDGSMDGSFNAGLTPISQLAFTNSTGSSNTEGLAFTPGGNLLICGQGAANLGGGMAVVRLTASGQIDTTFGVNGLASSVFGDGSTDDANTVVVNPDTGEFLLVGTTSATGQIQTAVAAFNSDGTPQTTFGTNGQQTLPNPAGAGNGNTGSASPFAIHGIHNFGAVAIFDAKTRGVVVGGSGSSASAFRRVKPFGVSVASVSNLPATVKHHLVRTFSVTLPNNTKVTITVTGGAAQIQQLQNQIELDLTASGPALVVSIKTRGSGPVFLSTVTVNGALRSFIAPTVTLAGTFSVSGAGSVTLGDISGVLHAANGIAHLTAGNVSGSVSCQGALGTVRVKSVTGTIAAGQNIANFSATSLSNATILAGVSLGTDGMLGGTGTAADNYVQGVILSLNVSGSIATSFIGAGVTPGADFIFGDGDDTSSSSGSAIKSITVRHGIDAGTRFESSSFPRFVHIPGRTAPALPTFVRL